MNGDMMFVGRGWNEGNICLATMHFCATHKQRNEARHERISSILTGGGNASRCLWAMLSQLLLLQCPLSSFTNSRRFFLSIFSSVLFFAVFYTLSRGFFFVIFVYFTHTHTKNIESFSSRRVHTFHGTCFARSNNNNKKAYIERTLYAAAVAAVVVLSSPRIVFTFLNWTQTYVLRVNASLLVADVAPDICAALPAPLGGSNSHIYIRAVTRMFSRSSGDFVYWSVADDGRQAKFCVYMMMTI